MSKDYSKSYKSAIAHLAEKLNNSGILKDIDLAELVKSGWIWDDLVKIKPEVQKLAYEVEEAINYELSFNQCCNAVNWVYKFSREEWKHLLFTIDNNMTTKIPVYKKNVATNKYIQVGTVDDYGFIEFDVPLYESIGNVIPQTFYPEFYTDYETTRVIKGGIEKKNDKGEVIGIETISIGSYISSIDKRVFIPKNLPTQLVSLSGSTFLESKDYYVTGYVDRDGMAVYYDQFIVGE